MSAPKHLLFIAGLLGLVGLFLPLFSAGRGPFRAELSAKELSFGLARTHQVVGTKIPGLLAARIPPDILQARADVQMIAEASRGAALAFVPAGLLLLLGVGAMWRGRSGRVIAAVGLLCGVASIAAYLGLRYGIQFGKAEEPLLERVEIHLRIGATLLIIAGVGGILGGVLGLLKPEPPRPRSALPIQPTA